MGHTSTLVPVMVDDLSIDELGQPLNMLQTVRLDLIGIITLVKFISDKLSLEFQTIPNFITTADDEKTNNGIKPGLYVGDSRLDFQSGWIPYTGDPKTLYVNKNYVVIGRSFSDGFRYPPVDSLTAPWRCFSFRFRSNNDVWMYGVVKLIDGTFRKLLASTALASWGFTGEPRDEYRIPLGHLKKGRWYVAIIDVQSIEHDLTSQVQCIVGFRARGPLAISHIWCVNSKDNIPNKYSKNALYIRYPR